ncbi:transcription factor bHLH112 isoform X3 [Dendrobium catenatum]|uniref:transcription factor bHLH112 isoform X3 n=1 Tax=Dendrobium catenatum TaxID=906689 RepID=UPI0010A0798A|nr:transcription factor bHLH112 isoform X3 [Dendrobium catenatum]
MADDFQPSNWWNKSKTCNEHSDSKLQFSGFGFSASCTDWSQTPISSSRSGIAEPAFHAMLQEDLSTADFFRQEVKETNQPLLLAASSSSSSSSSSYALRTPMSMIQSLVEPDTKFRRFLFDDQQMSDYQYQMVMAYGRGSNEIHQSPLIFSGLAPREQSAEINLMQFTNSSTFLNDSPGFYDHPPASPIGKPSFSSLIAKSSGEHQERKISSESVLKKPRIETSAPFKVRKEKLGDRITALQQLVSPFGKTDTASVLHEAIVHIKLLHDQVNVLSTPYLMNLHPMQQQKQNSGKSKKREEYNMQDLRSRGLCLVPVPTTCPVTSEASSHFWTPAFGGTYS